MTTTTMESVCNLDGERLEDRLTTIRHELLAHATGAHELADGLIYEFDATPDMRIQLEKFVAFERTCCGSLNWDVRETSSKLRLHVDGTNPRALRAQIEGDAATRSGSVIGRLAKAGGAGIGGALLICCVLPVGAALVLGVAVAAPFAFLEDPFWIGIGTLALAVPAWLFFGPKRAKTGRGCGC